MICSSDNWNVATVSRGNLPGFTLEPFKGFHKGKARKAECYGKVFATSFAANAYAFEHGFTHEHYNRPGGFIKLRLSPASRRWLRSQPKAKFWECLGALLTHGSFGAQYWRALTKEPYMADKRAEFEAYIASPGDAYRREKVAL